VLYIIKKKNKTNKFIKTLFSPVIKTNNFSKQQGESPNFYKNKFRQLLSFVGFFSRDDLMQIDTTHHVKRGQ
jgi:hypothetical protein